MVGWFVEQEQVGVLKQQPGQRQPPPLATAERLWRKLLIGFGEADAVEDLGDAVVVGVAIEAFVLVLDVAIFLDQRAEFAAGGAGHGRLQSRQPFAQPDDVGPAV